MTWSKYLKLVIAFLVLLLTIDIGSRLFFTPSVVNAKSKTQYKVVLTEPVNSKDDYEKFLNGMANQGWEFDHAIFIAEWAVFKK